MTNSKSKGDRWMRGCRGVLEKMGYRVHKRQLGEGGDDLAIAEISTLSLECKDWAKFSPWVWIAQCEANTPQPHGIGIVWFKQRGQADPLQGGLLIHARHLSRLLTLVSNEQASSGQAVPFFEADSISQ